MDNTYNPVSSNDTLLHLALTASPETLCGRIVVENKSNFSSSDMALKCDFCDTLSGGHAFLKYTESPETRHLASVHGINLDAIPSLIKEDEEALELFHKQAHIIQSAETDEQGAAVDSGRSLPGNQLKFCTACGENLLPGAKSCASCGTDVEDFVAKTAPPKQILPFANTASTKEAGVYVNCPDCGKAVGSGPDDLDQDEHDEMIKNHKADGKCSGKNTASVKESRNWTRDGTKIVDGFNLVITSTEASEIPFLDTSRVTISEKIHCPDCEKDEWLSRVASCIDCGEFKCDGCMDSSSYDIFVGTCKKCANTSNEEESFYLNSYDDTDYSLIQRSSGFFAEEGYDEEATFLPSENE